jgi:hypothetical protein
MAAAESGVTERFDPAILAWLVAEFPTGPLPEMLKPLTPTEFEQYRDDLARRLRAIALKTP